LVLAALLSSAGEATGSLLSSVGVAAKALLGGMLGTFEKEGAFEETAAAVTGGKCGCGMVSSNARSSK
jgi:hypothetical protein